MIILKVLLFTLLLWSFADGQPLSGKDYQAGPLAVGKFIREVLPVIGQPKQTSMHEQPQTGGMASIDGRDTLLPPDVYYVYEFDSLTIQTNGFGYIDYFQFVRHDFNTTRGISIGDTMQAVEQAYGENPEYGSEIEYLQDGVAKGIWFHFSAGKVTSIAMGSYTP